MDYRKKYMPMIRVAVAEARGSILSIAPSYFDGFAGAASVDAGPILADTIRRLIDWIQDESEEKKNLRAALPYTQRSPLLRKESAAKKHLLHFLRVAKVYEWHKQGARRQQDSKDRLHSNLPVHDFSCDSDYKEAFKVPVGNMLVGEDHFAPAQSQIGVFGAVLRQHVKGEIQVDKYLFISKVCEHPPFVTNIYWDKILAEVKDMQDKELGHFWSDCGNHYRSYCNLEHVCVAIPTTHKIKTRFENCCERHGKSEVDGLFGEFDMAVQDYLDGEDASIVDIDELENVLAMYFEPKPWYHVRRWQPEGPTPDTLRHLEFKGSYHVTRSYCVESVPKPSCTLGVEIRNYVFSDCDAYKVIRGDRVETTGNSRPYRTTKPKEKPWVKAKLPSLESTEIARRYDEQDKALPASGNMPAPWKTPEERLDSKLRELDRRAARAAASAKRACAASSSSTSSSPSSSSSSSSS
jgi:hypothetical protein